MQGAVAWNKGVPLSDEVRWRIAEAHIGKRHSKAVRQRMSQAAKGREVRPETAALLSERLTGLQKDPQHKARIAATQRRRHAAARVLQAVEAVYQRTSDESGSASSSSGGGGGALPRVPGFRLGGNGEGARRGGQQVLAGFKAQLREYRALQEELSPWTRAFVNKHARKPNLTDVQRTGIPWLVGKYKQYVLLRDRLFSETSLLRNKISGAVQGGRVAAWGEPAAGKCGVGLTGRRDLGGVGVVGAG